MTTDWITSSFSGQQNCVQVRFAATTVEIRDSKYLRDRGADPRHQPIIGIDTQHWEDFLAAILTTATNPVPTVRVAVDADGNVELSDGAVVLKFFPAEWQAFVAGVLAGEFDYRSAA